MHIYTFSQFKIRLYAYIKCVMFDMQFWHNTNVGHNILGLGSTKSKLGPTMCVEVPFNLECIDFCNTFINNNHHLPWDLNKIILCVSDTNKVAI